MNRNAVTHQVGEGLAVDLFGLQRLLEAFSLGDVEAIARSAHADGDVAISLSLAIGERSVLHTAIGVMNEAAGQRVARMSAATCGVAT